jgi:hypothetical protein
MVGPNYPPSWAGRCPRSGYLKEGWGGCSPSLPEFPGQDSLYGGGHQIFYSYIVHDILTHLTEVPKTKFMKHRD